MKIRVTANNSKNVVSLPAWMAQKLTGHTVQNLCFAPEVGANFTEDGGLLFDNPTTAYLHRAAVAAAILDEADKREVAYDYESFKPVTVCMVYRNGRTLVGHAVCAPGDDFDKDIGAAIAYCRAVGKSIPSCLLHF